MYQPQLPGLPGRRATPRLVAKRNRHILATEVPSHSTHSREYSSSLKFLILFTTAKPRIQDHQESRDLPPPLQKAGQVCMSEPFGCHLMNTPGLPAHMIFSLSRRLCAHPALPACPKHIRLGHRWSPINHSAGNAPRRHTWRRHHTHLLRVFADRRRQNPVWFN